MIRFFAAAAIATLALVCTPGAKAQDLGDLPQLAQRCAGPTSALLPECAALRNSLKGSPPAVPPRVATQEPARVPERPSPPQPAVETSPALPPQPPTEFQRFIASSTGETPPVFGSSLFEGVPTTFAPVDRIPVTADYVIGPGDELLLRVWGQITLNLPLTVDRSGAVYIPDVGNVHVAGLEFRQLEGYMKSQLGRVFRNFELNVNMGELRSIQIFVVGHARRPGTYTVSSMSTLVNALFSSGGPSSGGSMRRIQLRRGKQVVSELDVYELLLNGDKSADVRLLPGDLLYIPAAGPQVAVSGSVRTPGIYELHNERSVGELLALCGGLVPTADRARGSVERLSGNARQVLDVGLHGEGLSFGVQDGDLLRVRAIVPKFDNAVTLRGNIANPGRFAWKQGMRVRDIIPEKAALLTRDYYSKRNLLGYTPASDLNARTPDEELKRKPSRTEIEAAAPDINWSYAVVERQNAETLATELMPFHLGKLLMQDDAAQNVELRPGDVVTIFSQADIRVPVSQQNRLVRLEGEFNSAGIYAAKPGETLAQLIARAGGLTPQAYLFGSQFTRESTRREQQLRLDQFVSELEREIDRTASSRLAAAITTEENASLTARLENERRVVERMRAAPVTGRIVLRLDPGNPDLSKLMNLPLEDGDVFAVPSRPGTVHVFGAVYNQNSFIHEPGLRVRDYISQAGGPMRNADDGHMFVIRADGTVVPKHDPRFGLFKKDFEDETLSPGDSIVVPEAVLKTTLMRNLRDWSQVFAQFGLGAAAINVLR